MRNLIKKIYDSDIKKQKAEEVLAKSKDAGGNVSYSKDANKYVEVLWIQSADMLKTEKPRLFNATLHLVRFIFGYF